MDTLVPIVCVLIFQPSLFDKTLFGTIIKWVDYTGVLINRFHCIYKPAKPKAVVYAYNKTW